MDRFVELVKELKDATRAYLELKDGHFADAFQLRCSLERMRAAERAMEEFLDCADWACRVAPFVYLIPVLRPAIVAMCH